jgi:hypothetical protein
MADRIVVVLEYNNNYDIAESDILHELKNILKPPYSIIDKIELERSSERVNGTIAYITIKE